MDTEEEYFDKDTTTEEVKKALYTLATEAHEKDLINNDEMILLMLVCDIPLMVKKKGMPVPSKPKSSDRTH